MEKPWYSKKWIVISIHAAAWILLFSLPALLSPSHNPNEKQVKVPNGIMDVIVPRISDALLISFFYLNAFILIPQFFYKKKYIVYIVSIIVFFALYVPIMWFLWVNLTKQGIGFTFNRHLFFSTFIFLFILACSIAYKTISDKVISDRLASQKETENLKTELSLLRSQVSPHFMFNMLYETDEEKVSLEKETEYLQSYIDLQQQRFGKKVLINVKMCKADKVYFIEPMLLIPFVENAFKHGTGMIENAHIDIELKAENNILNFRVSNQYDPSSIETKDKSSGIGLTNVQRRLQLLHPGKHTLRITKDNSLFTVSLQINLA